MTMVLIREGNRYRPEVEMDVDEMPDRVVVAEQDEDALPTKIEIWGAGIPADLATKLLAVSAHGDKD